MRFAKTTSEGFEGYWWTRSTDGAETDYVGVFDAYGWLVITAITDTDVSVPFVCRI